MSQFLGKTIPLTEEELDLKATPVLEHITQANKAYAEQCKARGETWFAQAPTDPDYVSRWDNAYEYELDMAKSVYSDFYKELRGFRPRKQWGEATLLQVEGCISRLG